MDHLINQTTFDTFDGDEYFKFDVPVSDMSTNDDRLIYYDWLADSACPIQEKWWRTKGMKAISTIS